MCIWEASVAYGRLVCIWEASVAYGRLVLHMGG